MWLNFMSIHVDIAKFHIPNLKGTGKTEGKNYLEKVREKQVVFDELEAIK
jgi:tryptophan 2,3-dioxygenase